MRETKSWLGNGSCRWLLAAVAALGLCLGAGAQATTSLRGAVTDPSGAAVPGAVISITDTATNLTSTTVSAADGRYSFTSVLPGTYTLKAVAHGFSTYVRPGLQLQVSLPTNINVALKVGEVSQTVEVHAAAPVLNTTDASVGQTMGHASIESLPLQAENMNLLLSLQPGVVFTGTKNLDNGYRSGSVNGERTNQNNITLDGTNNNDVFGGGGFDGILPSTPFSVQEFRVTTSNFDATQGRTSGAQVALVTRGGTNQYHGSLYEFNRSNVGEANDFFLKTAQVLNCSPTSTVNCNQVAHLVRNVYGGTIGGPVLHNKLFFFFNYEGQRESQGASVQQTIPSATLRQGIIQYACATASQCPGMSVTGADGKSYAIAPGYYGLGPAQLKAMDPLAIGPSSVAMQYFNTYPLPNASGVNDEPNFGGYRFAAPTRDNQNWYIGRIDYKMSPNQTVFFRGTAVNDNSVGTPFLPGGPPQTTTTDLSKGFVLGYTAVGGPDFVNNLRYGLTRQSVGTIGDSILPWVEVRQMSQDINRSGRVIAPVQNFQDTVAWQRGSHNFTFGANFLFVNRWSANDYTSYSDALTNADWVASSGFAGKGDALDPATAGYPAVAASGSNAYDFPLAGLMGIASEVDTRYNYAVTSFTQATPIPQGAPITRNWVTRNYSMFAQDNWQLTPDISLSYGLNYQIMTPMTETNGQQVTPNVNMGDWFNTRAANMVKGVPSSQDALIAFQPGGSVWNQPGLYSTQHDWAPRFGVAWSPHPGGGWMQSLFGNGLTSIRGGLGLYYDYFGPALALSYSNSGSFGLSSVVQNPAATLTIANAPRITSMNVIPTQANDGTSLIPAAPSSTYPTVYPSSEAIARGIDQSIQSPYSIAADFSIERQLASGLTLDLGYVGHFSRHTLVHDDIAMPTDLVDTKTGIDYFAAATRFSQLARANTADSAITPTLVGSTASYWTDMFAAGNYCGTAAPECYKLNNMPKGSTTGSLLEAAYAEFAHTLYNETSGLYSMDRHGNPAPPAAGINSFYNPQFSSLYVWRSIGYANYNGFELGLHDQATHGLTLSLNYTLSKSLGIESMPEFGRGSDSTMIINAWAPDQMYGPSDFDLRHQLNAFWVWQLPLGQGQYFGRNATGLLNTLIGGWKFSGTTRWTSGLPASVFMGFVWPTNWEEMGLANRNANPVVFGQGSTPGGGAPNVFANPTDALNGFDYAYPGQSGIKNNIRGGGFFGVDVSLAKQFRVPGTESQNIEGRANIFNLTNTPNFDPNSAQLDWASASTFGAYSSTLNSPRVMEFSLIYSF